MGRTRKMLVALNLALNEWGEDLFRKIAHAYLRRRRSKNIQHTPILFQTDVA